ncbi:MAG: hypothetical protein LBU23_01915 [Planctomycetota bacterium]|jgi:hypothetical protein|nr:hypothetical protein [Planctomycetota bacterium]
MADESENDENLDVLQNIEFAVVSATDEFKDADDYDVMHALDILIKDFRDFERGREPKKRSLEGAAQAIFRDVMAICLWRMGKGAAPGVADGESAAPEDIPEPPPLPAATLSRCLKKIRKSVDNWNGVGGRRGYLEFIRRYFPPGSAEKKP